MTTGRKAAKDASRMLREKPVTPTQKKTVAGSDLSQAKKPKKHGK
jgi:hypothetical protein